MKIALVHDYLREYGGAERVLEVLHEMYPKAPLFTSFVDFAALGEHAGRFTSWNIKTSWVQHNWLVKKYHSPLRFLTPFIWSSFDLSEYDVIISSSGWFMCRGVKTYPHQKHISYIHHPPRNLYGYPTGRPQSLIVKMYAAVINPFLRSYDQQAMKNVTEVVANSQETAQRIKRIYGRDSTVIYPPVDLENRTAIKLVKNSERKYFLSVARLTHAKRIDLAIKASNELKLPLKVVGVGREDEYLHSIAGPTVEFLGAVSDQKLSDLYGRAKALIFCALQEDFGMVPVEAMRYGTPVIALKQGGVMETVVDGKTGLFFESPDESELKSTLEKFLKTENRFTPKASHVQAEKFSKAVFVKKIRNLVGE